jgi:hypothetical protein
MAYYSYDPIRDKGYILATGLTPMEKSALKKSNFPYEKGIGYAVNGQDELDLALERVNEVRGTVLFPVDADRLLGIRATATKKKKPRRKTEAHELSPKKKTPKKGTKGKKATKKVKKAPKKNAKKSPKRSPPKSPTFFIVDSDDEEPVPNPSEAKKKAKKKSPKKSKPGSVARKAAEKIHAQVSPNLKRALFKRKIRKPQFSLARIKAIGKEYGVIVFQKEAAQALKEKKDELLLKVALEICRGSGLKGKHLEWTYEGGKRLSYAHVITAVEVFKQIGKY